MISRGDKEKTRQADRQMSAVVHLPGAGRTASGGVGRELAAEPVAVEVGGGMVRA